MKMQSERVESFDVPGSDATLVVTVTAKPLQPTEVGTYIKMYDVDVRLERPGRKVLRDSYKDVDEFFDPVIANDRIWLSPIHALARLAMDEADLKMCDPKQDRLFDLEVAVRQVVGAGDPV